MIEPNAMRQPNVDIRNRAEIERAIANGAEWRRDERYHKAGQLHGTYQIRLNIARDSEVGQPENVMVTDLAFLVANLAAQPERDVAVYFLRSQEMRCWIFEDYTDGVYLGCLSRAQ